jgi:hypothetical protein
MRCCFILAIFFCVIPGGFVRGDRLESALLGPREILSVLPQGSKIATIIKGYNCIQNAIYDCDINDDDEAETLVFYQNMRDDTEELHLAVITKSVVPGQVSTQVVGECAMGGSYFWSPDISVRRQAGGGVVMYCATAVGASIGATVSEVSITPADNKAICKRTILQGSIETLKFKYDEIEYTLRHETKIRHLPIKTGQEPATQPARPNEKSLDDGWKQELRR